MVSADRKLCLIIDRWDESKLKEFDANKGLKWHFTIPLAPHQTGCSELMVKTTKSALKKAVGDAILKSLELYTCLLEVANLVNESFFGRIPNDPDVAAGTYICRNDILLERETKTVSQGLFHRTQRTRDIDSSFVKRLLTRFGKGDFEMPCLNCCKERNRLTCKGET